MLMILDHRCCLGPFRTEGFTYLWWHNSLAFPLVAFWCDVGVDIVANFLLEALMRLVVVGRQPPGEP
jgi:hypothetical protein